MSLKKIPSGSHWLQTAAGQGALSIPTRLQVPRAWGSCLGGGPGPWVPCFQQQAQRPHPAGHTHVSSSHKTMGGSVFLSSGKRQEKDVPGSNPGRALGAPTCRRLWEEHAFRASLQRPCSAALDPNVRAGICPAGRQLWQPVSGARPAGGDWVLGAQATASPAPWCHSRPCEPVLPAWAEVRGLGRSPPAAWTASVPDCWRDDKAHRLTGPNPKKLVLKSWIDAHPRWFLTIPAPLVTSIYFSSSLFFSIVVKYT